MKRVIFALGGAVFAGALTVVLVRLAVQQQTAIRLRIDSPKGVDSLEKIRLGGVAQAVQIRGDDRTKPVLLFLHGGPGFPEMPFAAVNAELARDFVVVQWDQRGAGKSYSRALAPSSMTIAQFVSDTHELVQMLRERFHAPKIFLVAHSWGTIIGARAVAQNPELFYAYVGISQVANPPESERLMYAFALQSARARNVSKAVRELQRIGLPPYKTTTDYRTLKYWIHHFNDSEFEGMSAARFVELAFAAPTFSWADTIRLWEGYRFSFAQLWREAFAINFFAEIPTLEVPVYFFLGRHDRTATASAELAERYFEELRAPQGKTLVWFEKSGHFPHLNEPEKYRAQLLQMAEATGASSRAR